VSHSLDRNTLEYCIVEAFECQYLCWELNKQAIFHSMFSTTCTRANVENGEFNGVMYAFQGLKHLSCWRFIFTPFHLQSYHVCVLLRLHFKWHLSGLVPSIRVRAVQWPERGLRETSHNAKRCLWGRSKIPRTVKLTCTFTEDVFFFFFCHQISHNTTAFLAQDWDSKEAFL